VGGKHAENTEDSTVLHNSYGYITFLEEVNALLRQSTDTQLETPAEECKMLQEFKCKSPQDVTNLK
jgi:hypothetical protein